MQVTVSILDPTVGCRDVAITAPDGTTLAQLRPLLAERLGLPPGAAMSSDGRPLPPSTRVGDTGLRAGAVLRIGAGERQLDLAGSVLQLRVVSGPDCGLVVPLQRGAYVVGRATEADITIVDPDISRAHCEIRVDQRSVTIRDLGSTNGTRVGDHRIGEQPAPLPVGSLVQIGDCGLSVLAGAEPPAITRPAENGRVLVHRPPRIPENALAAEVHFPETREPGSRPKVQWFGALLPVVLAVALAFGMHSSEFLAFALLSPITVFATAISDRRDWRRGARLRRSKSESEEQEATQRLEALLVEEGVRRRHRYADAAEVMHAASTPTCRLWERRPADTYFLELRLGIGDLAAETGATRGGKPVPGLRVGPVPATVDLAEGPLGLAGPFPLSQATGRWLVAQLLTLNSPVDITVLAIVAEQDTSWQWLRWTQAGVPVIARSTTQHRAVIDEVRQLVAQRLSTARLLGDRWTGRWLVLLLDPVAAVAEVPGLRWVLDNGPLVGVSAICIGQDLRMMPPSCRSTAVAVCDTGTQLEIRTPERAVVRVVADRVSNEWADQLGRRLAPLRDADTDASADLPDRLSLLDLLGLDCLDSGAVLSRWSDSGGRPCAPLGVTSSGPFQLDLVEDGPHLLVAGTTGSGKSELLRSMVVALAATCSPSELAFVLIDYKGGAAFDDCLGLPHVVGVVTDLDSHLTRRALICLDAELKRRELAFAQVGAPSLREYLRKAPADADPLPRLVLVIDEFASLAEELPDFLTGLMGIAQRGRSLGVHLVLATQRPAGVVSLDIKANMSTRIALRVTDPSESSDVIADVRASQISKDRPGRAWARTGNGELTEFQTARTALPRTRTDSVSVECVGPWHETEAKADSGEAVVDDLTRLRASIDKAARTMLMSPQCPWLPPLPERITAADLPEAGPSAFIIPYGLTDEPERQRQVCATHDLSIGCSIGLIGGPRSGRSTALRTLLVQAASRLSADELHLYLVDAAGQSFRPLDALPHCGAVVDRDDPPSVIGLISRLVAEMADRKRRLAALGTADVAEALNGGVRIPVVIIGIDGWEGLTEISDTSDGGRSAELVIQLLREGPAAGFSVFITGDRAALTPRLASALTKKLLLPMTDRTDYAMAGLPGSAVPSKLRAGRAVCAEDGLETQFALLDPDPSTAAQWNCLEQVRRRCRPATQSQPIRLRPLPTLVPWKQLSPLPVQACGSPPACLLGVGGDEAQAIHCDLFAPHGRFLISGPARSGRSSTALLIAEQPHAAGLRMLLAASNRSPLLSWALQNDRPVWQPGSPAVGPNSSTNFDRPDVIVIDDVEQFHDTATGEDLLTLLAGYAGSVIVSARAEDLLVSFRGIGVEVRRHRTGLLLQPARADGELLGIRVGPVAGNPVAGRGLLVTDRTRQTAPNGLPIQVAQVTAAT